MQNIAEIRGMLGQIGGACVEIVRGCELAQSEDFDVDTLDAMVVTFRELLANAEKLRKRAMSSTIDPEMDHDGDTQPTNDLPDQPVCECGHQRKDHMPAPGLDNVFGAGCCIFCQCEGFAQQGCTCVAFGLPAEFHSGSCPLVFPVPSGK